MNIKEAEARSGVSRRNIRFYEQKGLLAPNRNNENGYRDYDNADIEILKLIRVLRMVDMPLEQVREVVLGQMPLREAAASHKHMLKERMKELETAVRFCDELSAEENLDIDQVLRRMEEPENRGKLSSRGDRDYAETATRLILSLAAGLIPCFVGTVFGLVSLGAWFDMPVVSYVTSITAMLLWSGFGYWAESRGCRPWEAVLIHVIPAAACVCYVLTKDMLFNPFGLFITVCYLPVMAALTPFSFGAESGLLAMLLPFAVLAGSFLVGYSMSAFLGKDRKPAFLGRFILAAVVLVPVAAVIACILFAPLPTIATSDYLKMQLDGEAPVWVESGGESYEVVGSPEFCELFRLEEWERIRIWTNSEEPVLEIHMHSDCTEPYAIAFYRDGTVRVYETWITTEAGYFQVPEELVSAILEYAKRYGTLQ